MNGYGEMRYVNGDKYSGQWNNGNKDGYGEMEYNNGDKYNG